MLDREPENGDDDESQGEGRENGKSQNGAHENELLDAALGGTFPASDPISTLSAN